LRFGQGYTGAQDQKQSVQGFHMRVSSVIKRAMAPGLATALIFTC
jgi:hypothetical protein